MEAAATVLSSQHSSTALLSTPSSGIFLAVIDGIIMEDE